MARSGSMRWRGWRTSRAGGDLAGLAPRKCTKCGRKFRPRKKHHRLCKSCLVAAERERKVKPKATKTKRRRS